MKLCWEAMGGAPESCVRGPLTFTPPPRLLCLEAMVPGLKMALKSVRVTGAQTPGESSVNITVSGYDTTHLQENPQRIG